MKVSRRCWSLAFCHLCRTLEDPEASIDLGHVSDNGSLTALVMLLLLLSQAVHGHSFSSAMPVH